ncbi:MAG: type IV secretory system conjugative DNA transfer family protein [Oscillospiraceae bacterium]|jgi:type IV secretion system protein VirD4|nr:type IV secretory system conjugative DNA transfer family protein [Oscillospiraceae bacterium]
MLKKIISWFVLAVVAVVVLGYFVNVLIANFTEISKTQDYSLLWEPGLLLDTNTYVYGAVLCGLLVMLYLVFANTEIKRAKKMMRERAQGFESALENSRFLTDKERDGLFKPYNYSALNKSKKDGVPVRAYMKGRELKVNLASPMHGLIIGATGSGKTTTFINPMVQILGETQAGSSMILTDPKGELFQMHSQKLKEKGYKVMVLDLRDPYSSYRWNPLENLYKMYQEYLERGKGIYQRTDLVTDSGLTLNDPAENYGEAWFEYDGVAYADGKTLKDKIKVLRQRIYDECYEDMNDLVGVLCPIESPDDPVWEKGARSIIMATLLAMLEDSENPDLEMTVEKFNFFNLSKAISNSENEFAALKRYFQGRSQLSKAVTLSRQVLAAADNTLSSYMSIAFDKMGMFNDEGICALTSATDINPDDFADQPTALFMKIPDEKDTRHGLAAVFVLCIYKALIKKASAREDLSLPRNVYFILDEFGNMPKIDKFDKMITVGRSRKIWFNMVVQSYAQLSNVYDDKIADIIKSNCGIKMFIGSNDIDTCKEFSELCGNMTIATSSVSGSLSSKEGGGGVSVSTQMQSRPLIYPSDLQKLNNANDTGNSIIVTFGNYPLKTKYTPSYKCKLYKFGIMDLSDVRSNVFYSDEVYYDLEYRNNIIIDAAENTGNAEGGENNSNGEVEHEEKD